MAQIPDLQPTAIVNDNDEILMRQSGEDFRITIEDFISATGSEFKQVTGTSLDLETLTGFYHVRNGLDTPAAASSSGYMYVINSDTSEAFQQYFDDTTLIGYNRKYDNGGGSWTGWENTAGLPTDGFDVLTNGNISSSPILLKSGEALFGTTGGSTRLQLISADMGFGVLVGNTSNAVSVLGQVVTIDSNSATVVKGGSSVIIESIGGVISMEADSVYINGDPIAGVPTANKQVIVNDASDFPDPIGGFIQLEDFTNYLIGDDVNYSDDIVGGIASSITGLSVFAPALIYTGSGTVFTSVGSAFQVRNIQVQCANATKIFDISGSVLLLSDAQFLAGSGTAIGNFNEVPFNLANDVGFTGIGQGATITNTSAQVLNWSMVSSTTTNPLFVGLDLGTSLYNTLILNDFRINGVVGGVVLSGLANSGNMIPNTIATVTNCSWVGGVTGLAGITSDDFRWKFSGNNIVPDTMPDALISLTDNVQVTTITATSTPVKVVGTFVCERQSQFDCDTTGRATYLGERPLTSPIDVSVTLLSDAGKPNVAIYIAIDGFIVPATKQESKVEDNKPISISTMWQTALTTGSYIEVYIANTSDVNDLVVDNAIIRVR